MPDLYSYTYLSDGTGPWWGIRCSKQFYQDTIRQMHETSRCFVHLTNSRGETIVVAVEGFHDEGENVFAPEWVLKRLGLQDGEEVVMEAILEPLPRGETVRLQPMTGHTVEGPMFLEGLTEALNQLGVVQEGRLSAIVDPSRPVLPEFLVTDLTPARVCLADGELRVELEPAMDRPPTPLTVPVVEPEVEPEPFDCSCELESMVKPLSSKGYVPFGGTGYRLDRN